MPAPKKQFGEQVLAQIKKSFPKGEWKKVATRHRASIEKLTKEIGQLALRQLKGENVASKIKVRKAALQNYIVAAQIDAARLASKGWDSLLQGAVQIIVQKGLGAVLKALV